MGLTLRRMRVWSSSTKWSNGSAAAGTAMSSLQLLA